MAFDRLDAEKELGGDLRVRAPEGNKPRHLELACAQRLESDAVGRARTHDAVSQPCGDVSQPRGVDAGVETLSRLAKHHERTVAITQRLLHLRSREQRKRELEQRAGVRSQLNA